MMSCLGTIQPSLRDSYRMATTPSVETLGYCQPSLRDENLPFGVELEFLESLGRGRPFADEL